MINQDLQSQLRSAGYKGEFELSELIEACGDGFKGLFPPKAHKWFYGWFAIEKIGYIDKDGALSFWSFHCGSTPEEAVANLWLSLNEK